MKVAEPSGRGARPGAQRWGLRDLFPSHSGDCGVLGSLYTYASDRASGQPQPQTPFPGHLGFSLLPQPLSAVRAHPRTGGGGRQRPALGRQWLASPRSPRSPPHCLQPPAPEARSGGGVGVTVMVGALGIFLQRSEGAPNPKSAAGKPYLRPGQAAVPADHQLRAQPRA